MILNPEIKFCTYFKCIKQFTFKSETYSEYTAFCVKSGKFSYQIGNFKQQIVSEGEIVICPPGKSFKRKIITPVEMCMIKFNISDDFSYTPPLKITDISRFEYNMKKLESCLFCSEFDKFPVFLHYCRDILYMAADSLEENSALSKIKKEMFGKFDDTLSIEKLAKNAGYSVAHFINTFKKVYGYTPKQYFSYVKIQKAKNLLSTTDMMSKEAAALCGFDDELYFIRFFKKHTGMTPKQFQKQYFLQK